MGKRQSQNQRTQCETTRLENSVMLWKLLALMIHCDVTEVRKLDDTASGIRRYH